MKCQLVGFVIALVFTGILKSINKHIVLVCEYVIALQKNIEPPPDYIMGKVVIPGGVAVQKLVNQRAGILHGLPLSQPARADAPA